MGSPSEPAGPAYRSLRVPRKRPQVLVVALNRSESSRPRACPRLSLPPPTLGERRHRGLARRRVANALIAFMAATAQAQAEATKEAQRAGIAHAKANGDARAYKGRKPSYNRKQFENAQAMLAKSASVGEVARTTGLTRQTVYRIKDDPAAAEAALATWGI
jgi:flagellar biosynthesis/type III secretory pathway protein FliH